MIQRKRLLAAAISLGVCVLPMTAFAETAVGSGNAGSSATSPVTTQTPVAAIPFVMDSDVAAFMEVFLVNIKVDYLDQAYQNTSMAFKKNINPMLFAKMVKGMGLKNIASKEWTALDKAITPPKVDGDSYGVLKGNITDNNGIVHDVSLRLLKRDKSFAIDSVTETLTPEILLKLFPKDDVLKKLIAHDLEMVRKAILVNGYTKLYRGMSPALKQTVTLAAFRKSLQAFRKEGKDMSGATASSLVFDKDSPKVSQNGVASVKGTYVNAKYTVQFELDYSYAWEWKLSGINVNPVAIGGAAASAPAVK